MMQWQDTTRLGNPAAQLGEKEEALAWLEKAYRERDPWLMDINVRAEFDSLRDDPRFQDLLRRMNFPPQ